MKHKRLLLIAAILALFAALSIAHAEAALDDGGGAFLFPSSLRIIENNAFQGTAAIQLVIPDGTEYIGDEAFADIPGLESAFIPPSVRHIGDDAFRGSDRLTVFGVKGSFAHDWARARQYRFVHWDIWVSVHRAGTGCERRDYPLHREALLNLLIFAAILAWKAAKERGITCPREKPEMYPLEYDFP